MIKFFEKSFGRSESNKDVRITNSCATGGLRFSFSPRSPEFQYVRTCFYYVGGCEEKFDAGFFSEWILSYNRNF